MSAYACAPGVGSEPGVGWNIAQQMSKYHEIWVFTRSNNRPMIENVISRNPCSSLHFVYVDLPFLFKWCKRVRHLHYYLWQVRIFFTALQLHKAVGFDLVHHVTYGRYWTPSLISLLPVSFLWGPVGGGESAPKPFWRLFGWKGVFFELARDLARWLGEHDPLVILTARRSVIALATTSETAQRLQKIGCKDVRVMTQCSMPTHVFAKLSKFPMPNHPPVRFISLGRPLHWKGFELGIRAFAKSQLTMAEYWLVCNGPERKTYVHLVESLHLTNRVRLIEKLPTLDDVYMVLSQAHILVHPALHEAFGNVVLEALAAGKPVICLDLGGPATQVSKDVGFKIAAHTVEQAIADLAEAMRKLATDHVMREQMSQAALDRVSFNYLSDHTEKLFDMFYAETINHVRKSSI